MKILVIGSGGREHALAWKIAQSSLADKVFCAPGNAGIAQQAECLGIKPEDIPRLLEFARRERIDLTVVGPEIPLALGIVDEFRKYNLKIFGPDKAGARLEASKVFSKELMRKFAVPTADFRVFDNLAASRQHIDKIGAPCVVKADGLAAGKGVVVASSVEEAKQAAYLMLEEKIFGEAGSRIVIEECLEGQEASILVVTDGEEVIALASSQDHKRVFDDDKGPNTGGMGAYSPAPVVTPELFKEILNKIVYRTIDGLAKEGIDYRGILYAGIMLTKDGPKTLEFNVRFGDPETQAIIPRLKSDLVELLLACSEKKLNRLRTIEWDSRACVCVVMASGGYPGEYEKGKEVFGLDEASCMKDIVVFHAGTKLSGNKILTSGGRVLGVTGRAETIKQAIANTYSAVAKIKFGKAHFRRDIGRRATEK